MRPKSVIFILVMLSQLYGGGCTVFQKHILKPLPLESPAEQYAREYLQQASTCEVRGDLAAALKQYTLALTVAPSNGEALAGRDRIQGLLERSAESHYQKGLALKQEGKYDLARKAFLEALRLRPEHPQALEMLLNRERFEIKRYILHKIKPGESLAKLADFYYGDFRKFPIVAKYNHIIDATKIWAGETLKIPEIEGVAFLPRSIDVKTEALAPPDAALSEPVDHPKATEQEKNPEETQTVQEIQAEQAALYLDLGVNLFQEHRYQEALEEFAKVLKVHPENGVAAEHLYRLHLYLAAELLEQNEYLRARDHFGEALRYNATCEACRSGIRNSENLYKDFHYRQGMQHFGSERLLAAIEEWELVTALDPDYKRTDDLIQKARTILKNMEAIRAMDKNDIDP